LAVTRDDASTIHADLLALDDALELTRHAVNVVQHRLLGGALCG
jgi:hypothetical protein